MPLKPLLSIFGEVPPRDGSNYLWGLNITSWEIKINESRCAEGCALGWTQICNLHELILFTDWGWTDMFRRNRKHHHPDLLLNLITLQYEGSHKNQDHCSLRTLLTCVLHLFGLTNVSFFSMYVPLDVPEEISNEKELLLTLVVSVQVGVEFITGSFSWPLQQARSLASIHFFHIFRSQDRLSEWCLGSSIMSVGYLFSSPVCFTPIMPSIKS